MSDGEQTCQCCRWAISRQEQAYVANGRIACQQCDERLKTETHPASKQTQAGGRRPSAHNGHQPAKNRASPAQVTKSIIRFFIWMVNAKLF